MNIVNRNKYDIFIGSISIIMFFIFGGILDDPFGLYFDTRFEDFLISLPEFLALIPFVGTMILNIIFAIISPIKKRNKLFKTAIITTSLFLVCYIVSALIPNDDNPLILLFYPINFILYPFAIGFEPSFSNLYFFFIDSKYLNDSTNLYLVIVLMTVVLPTIIYLSIKKIIKAKQDSNL